MTEGTGSGSILWPVDRDPEDQKHVDPVILDSDPEHWQKRCKMLQVEQACENKTTTLERNKIREETGLMFKIRVG